MPLKEMELVWLVSMVIQLSLPLSIEKLGML